MNSNKSYNFSIGKFFISLLILVTSLNLLISAECDGNPIAKKFKVSNCDQRDIDVLNEIIKLNNLTKSSKTLFGNKKIVYLKPFEVGIQTWSYGRLISINLENLGLTILPNSIGILTTLEKLELSNNSLTSLPDEFGGLKPLKYLYLANNKLETLPNSIKNLDRLREIDLSNNFLKSLPDNFGSLKSLKLLDLNNNHLAKLPTSFKKFRNLIKLDLSNNQLSKLNRQIADLARLKEISARNNKITSIPENIGNLRNIERINLSGNKITTIPSSIGNCYTLISLIFSQNRLNSIPIEIGQLYTLEVLDLDNNNISKIPEEFNRLKKLVSLNLSNNKLSGLSKNIIDIYSIEYLDLSFNLLQEVPTSILSWTSIISLKLNNNNISSFDILNDKFPNLQKLIINNNPINSISFSTKNPQNIIKFDISESGLNELNTSICDFSNAQIILDNNSLCSKQNKCIEKSINHKRQYCTDPIIEYIEVVKEVIVENVVEVEVEVQKVKIVDKFPFFNDPIKQKLYIASSIKIIELDNPDTLFALFESPYEYTNIQPISNHYTYSISNSIHQNGRELNDFSFLESIKNTDLINKYKTELYESLKSYSKNPYDYFQVMAWQNTESFEYKLSIGFSWLTLTSWSSGILLKLSDKNHSLPLFLSAVVFKVIQKNLFDKIVTKKVLIPPPHFNQFLNYDQLIEMAEKHNKQIFKEINSIN